jgi:uncharacterized protein YndB with AHSA1/START domain
MNMLLKIVLALVVILLALVIVIATRPSEFSVARSATIAAPPASVFAQVNDLHQWEKWSPWAKLDPTMTIGYEGAPTGVGSSYKWSGNNEVGEGRSTIVESRPDESVRFKLEFVRPFAGTNDVQFTFQPEGTGTLVTWAMSGKNTFMSMAVGLVMDCEKMCGGMFEQGLANLRTLAEGTPKS